MAGMAIAIPGGSNISKTGYTMGKIRWHRGKKQEKMDKKLGKKNRCLYPCHPCQSGAMPPLIITQNNLIHRFYKLVTYLHITNNVDTRDPIGSKYNISDISGLWWRWCHVCSLSGWAFDHEGLMISSFYKQSIFNWVFSKAEEQRDQAKQCRQSQQWASAAVSRHH